MQVAVIESGGGEAVRNAMLQHIADPSVVSAAMEVFLVLTDEAACLASLVETEGMVRLVPECVTHCGACCNTLAGTFAALASD